MRTFIKTNLLVFTGAGISAESGIKTFRDTGGLWEEYSVDQVANYITWKNNFDLVHKFYNERRVQMTSVQPNRCHEMIAEWQRKYEAVVITQNVDDLLERGGCQDVIHVHGRIEEMKCEACGHVWNIGNKAWDAGVQSCPLCPSKRGVKPNVVFFHERAPEYETMNRALKSLHHGSVIVVMGTSGQVVQIGAMLDFRPGYKILSNLDYSPSTGMYGQADGPALEEYFDKCIMGPATYTVDEISLILKQKLG